MAYNSSKHSTTGVSPYRAVFGHEPRLPSDISNTQEEASGSRSMTSEEFNNHLIAKDQARRNLHQRMLVKIKESQERMKKYHRKRNAAPEFSVGDQVLLRNKKRDDRKGNKLETTWSSAVYTVDIVKGRNTYYISNNGKRLRKLVNSCHLKKYIV